MAIRLSLKKVVLYLTGILFLLWVITMIIARGYLGTYKIFTQRELVARIECLRDEKSNQKILNILLYPETSQTQLETIPFNADEWVFEGRIIQWKPLFGFFVTKKYYRIERLSSRYFDLEKEKSLPHQVHAFYKRPDSFWFFIYKHQKLLPFVEAAYGNSAFVPFEAGKTFYVYVTNTGFMIKDVTVSKKRNWWLVG